MEHTDLGDSSAGTYHADLPRGHIDHSQHYDQSHYDQSHTDATHIDGTWTHHFDHGHWDGGHADYSQHGDHVQGVHVDARVKGGSRHTDIP